MNVAVTGALSEPRARIANLINSTANGCFVESVNLQTHYLVCEEQGTKKALKAAKYGTAVISEAELREYLASGEFPSIKPPQFIGHRSNNFPEVEWTAIYDPVRWYRMTYCDAEGRSSIRTVVATGEGHCGNVRYLSAYDGERFKTYREDRIIELEQVSPPT